MLYLKINSEYIELLKMISSLSGLFSDSNVPYLYYRNAENLFCYALKAKNLSRDDTAFDALLDINGKNIGVGLKTFICTGNSSSEKIAEFNQLSSSFNSKDLEELARMIATARNERILFARRMYNVDDAIYHLVSRKENELRIFEENYDLINLEKIKLGRCTKSSLIFQDDKNNYIYNYSKSTLFKKFIVPENYHSIPIKIISEPYQLLLNLKSIIEKEHKMQSYQYEQIVLPLYSTRNNDVPKHSGLNQWNANGRKRNADEVYIPVPSFIRDDYPDFFPPRDQSFDLKTPDGKLLNAKICQENGKALMTNPNSALADWLLRQLLNLEEGELATMHRLQLMDCDSVIITKISDTEYRIDKAKFGAYREFSSQ
ncbi:restriction endonuclease PLD domain-containing protein [Avibacterium sp. 20-129]|uniref:restriction endonuclease PLD domain-containing protein n=1 Tax=Avibacterium sp. 20-129 TaxID=2911525 RepID=UPI002245B62D|nr:restriction endonuclease PLD domain-containing protein [Avibacterium sp. 20-129]MCW9699240.1 NgoFVII family restriction endonuclease [Avibacterium sp. 20-129]